MVVLAYNVVMLLGRLFSVLNQVKNSYWGSEGRRFESAQPDCGDVKSAMASLVFLIDGLIRS